MPLHLVSARRAQVSVSCVRIRCRHQAGIFTKRQYMMPKHVYSPSGVSGLSTLVASVVVRSRTDALSRDATATRHATGSAARTRGHWARARITIAHACTTPGTSSSFTVSDPRPTSDQQTWTWTTVGISFFVCRLRVIAQSWRPEPENLGGGGGGGSALVSLNLSSSG